MLLHAIGIEKSVPSKTLFCIDELKIYAGDRIGLIGDNGCGKTTLLNILAGVEMPERGTVKSRCDIAYVRQFASESEIAQGKLFSEFHLTGKVDGSLSGGEYTKAKIANALGVDCPLTFLDEPTSNLDARSRETLYQKLNALDAFVVVSHDRELLDLLCMKIWEIKNQSLRQYSGNYSDYLECLEIEDKTAWREYYAYADEKKRLTNLAAGCHARFKKTQGSGTGFR